MSTGDRALRWRRAAACFAGALLGLLAPLGARTQAPPAAPNAGKIATLIPVDSVVRERKTLQAAKDMPLFWGDLVKTEKGGRVRVQLNDGSILNIGSQSSVLIQRHDAGAQQTDLQLIYGRMRSDVVKIVQPGGSFNVRTTAAVAGVIGTQEYLEATDILTTVIALGGGNVAVRSTDPRYTETILLAPGEAITAITAHPLGQKRPATQQELQKAFESTEAGPIATLQAPAQAAPGQTVQTFIAGKGLATTTGVTSTQPGIQVQISGPVTATQIPVTITVANNVPVGTYPLIVSRPEGILRALLVVSSLAAGGGGGGAGGPIQPPSSQSFSVNQGAKLTLDASSASTPSGTQIVAYQWQVTGTAVPASAVTQLTSNQSTFLVDTNLLPLGNYTIQLALVNSGGQSATQQYPLTVVGVPQPQDVIAQLAAGYESLQPAQFLKNFDEQRFANYASFAEAVQQSFTTKLASVRVFQRPATCSIVQEQGTANCQVDFQVQFTLQNEPSVFINSSGNPVPAGTPGATFGKPIETGTEHATLRFYRGDSGWKIVSYTATVSCPGGGTSSGVNVGSCILAIGSSATPSFSLTNLQLPNDTNVTAGSSSPANEGIGTVTGQFDIVPAGGFNGSVTLTAQPSIPGITVAFSPAGSVSSGTVHFTVSATASIPPIPPDFNGTLPFTVVISGSDSTGTVNESLPAPVRLSLRADYSLSATSPVAVTPGGTISIPVRVIPAEATPGFNGNVTISLQSPPAGFTANSITVAGGAIGNLMVQVAATATSGSQPLTIQGRFAAITRITTTTVNVSAVAPFTLIVTSPTTTVNVIPAGTLPVTVQVAPAPGVEFTGPVNISFPTPLFPVINPQPISVPGSATYTVLPDANLRAGPASFVVQGTFGAFTVTATVNVNVLVPFTLSVAPAPNAVPGVTLHLAVTLSPIAGFPTVGIETVTLRNPIPAGFSATPFSITTGSGPQDFKVTVDPSTVLGNYTLNVLATFDNVSQAASVPVTVVAPFSLSVTPATTATTPAQIAQGATLSLTVQVLPVAGFTGIATISFPNLPTGITVSPPTNTLGSGSTIFTVSVSSTAATGLTQFNVAGAFGGNVVASSTVFVNVVPPSSFVLQVAPATSASSPINVIPTGTLPVQVSVVPVNGFTGTVAVSVQSNNEFTASPITLAAGSSGTLTVSVRVISGGLGPQQFVVQGTSGNLTQTSTVFVNVLFPFTLNVTPATTQASPANEAQGSTFTVSVQLVPVLGYSLDSAVSLSGPSFFTLPPGSLILSAGATGNFPVQVSANAPLGPATITVNATVSDSSVVTRSSVFVNVTTPPLFQIQQGTSNTSPLMLAAGSSASLPVSIVLSGSAAMQTLSSASSVTLSFGPLPQGVSVQPTTATLVPGATQTFTFSFSPGTVTPTSFGPADITLTGTASGMAPVQSEIVLDLVPASNAPFTIFSSNGTTLTLPSPLNPTNFFVGVNSGSFNQPITVSFSQIPAGVIVNPSTLTGAPQSISQCECRGLGPFQFLANPSLAVPGSYTVVATGTSGGQTATTTVALRIEGSFSLSVSPTNTQASPLVLTPGAPTPSNVTVTVASVNGFSGMVTVNFTIPFPATQVAVNPLRNTPNGVSVNLTVPAGGQAQQVFALTALPGASATLAAPASISGSSLSGQALNSILTGPFLAIGGPGFSVSSSTTSITLAAGGPGTTMTVQVTPVGGFNSPVILAPQPLTAPFNSGLDVAPTQETVQPGGQGQFFLNARGGSNATPGGPFTLNICGRDASGAITAQSCLAVAVTIQGQISLNVTDAVTNGPPGTQTNPIPIAPSTSHNFNVVVSGFNNFSGPVNLLVPPLADRNLTATFGSPCPTGQTISVQLALNQSITCPLTLTAGPPPGLTFNFEQINVQASSPLGLSSTNPSQTVFITGGNVAGFILGCDRGDHAVTDCVNLPPLTLNINQAGSVGTLQLRADSIGNLKDPVRVVPVGLPPLPPGVTMTPASLTITPQNALAGTDVPVTFTAQGPPAVSGSFSFMLTGTDTVNTAVAPSSTTVRLTLNGSLQLATAAATSPSNPVMITAGTPQSFGVTVTSNGFAGTVTLNATSNAPFPVTITPPAAPITVTAGGSTSATFSVTIPPGTPASAPFVITFDASATPGTYAVPGQTAVPLYLAVGPGSFTLQLNPAATLESPLIVPVNSLVLGTAVRTATLDATITPAGSFNSPITIDVLGLPSGISFMAQPVGGTAQTKQALSRGTILLGSGAPQTISLVFVASSSAPAGVVQATLTATSGSIVQSIPVELFVVPQVTVTVTPDSNTSPLAIPPAGSAQIQLGVAATPSFLGAADLTFGTLPPQLSVTPPTLRVNVGSSASFTLSVASSATPGTQLSFSVNASINGIRVSGTRVNVVVGTAAFSLSVSPASAVLPTANPPVLQPGGPPVSIMVTVNPIGGFSAPVTLTFDPQNFGGGNVNTPNRTVSVTPGQTAAIPFSASAGTPGGEVQVIITASGEGETASIRIAFSVGSGGFSLVPINGPSGLGSLNFPGLPLILDANSSSLMSVIVEAEANFSGTVTLVPSGLPSVVTVTPTSASSTPQTPQTFQLAANSQAVAGDTQFTITGTSGTLPAVTTPVVLRVRGTYSLSVSPGGVTTAPAVVAPGSSSLIHVSVAPVTFNQSVIITPDTSSLPAGITLTPASATATPSAPAAFTLTAASSAQISGVQAINFASSTPFGTTEPTSTLFYTVGSAPTFNLTAAPQAGTVLGVLIGDPVGSTEFVTLTPVGGFTGSVSVTVNNLANLPGVHANPAATTVNLAGTPVTVPIVFTADSTVQPVFTQAVTISAAAGSSPPLIVPVGLNLLGDYRLQPQATGPTQGNGSSASDPVILTPGTSPSFNLFVNAMDNFSGTVNLAITGSLPAGVTASITPTATLTTPGALTITVPASALSTPVFPITITATSTTAFTNPQKLTFFFEVASAPSINLIVPSAPVVVGIGSNQFTTFQIGFTGFVGGTSASPLNLTLQAVASTVPPGVTFSPTIGQASVHGSLNATGINLQVRADPPASAGPVSITLQAIVTNPATGGMITSGSAVVQLDLQGSYTLTTTPATSPTLPGVLAPGQSITYTVNAIGQNGFSSPITLTLNSQNLNLSCVPFGSPSLPSLCGVSVSPTMLTVTPGAPAQFTVNASASAPPAAITQISFNSSAPHATSSPTLPLYLAVGPASFSFVTSTFPSSPAGVMINGGPTTVTANFISLGGFSGPATLRVGTLPPGLTVSPQSASGTLSPNNNQNQVSFVFQADQRVPQGPLSVPVTVVSNGQSVTGFFYLYIISNLVLVQSPATTFSTPLALTPGDTTGQTVTLTLQSQGGVNTGAIPLTLSNVPPDLTVAPSSTTLSGGGSVALKVTASANATPVIHSFIASVSFAGLTAQTQLFFFVGPGDFGIIATPSSSLASPLVVNPGPTGTPVAVTVTPINGFTGSVMVIFTQNGVPVPNGMLANGVSVIPASAVIQAGQTAIFTVQATTALGTSPVQLDFTGNGVHTTSVFALVNPPSFTLSKTAAPTIALEQGNLQPFPFTVFVAGQGGFTGAVTISFADVPPGVKINPPTATVQASASGTAVTFNLSADQTAVPGSSAAVSVSGTSGSQTVTLIQGIRVVAPTSGIFVTTDPPTSATAPLLLQPDASLLTFVNINVFAKGGFTGMVSFQATQVPSGVTATLVPATADLTTSPLQVLQLQLRTTTGLAPFGPTQMNVVSATPAIIGGTGVFIALQTVSSVTKVGNTGSRTAPQVSSALPASGIPGSYTTVMVQGKALSGITSVLADSPFLSGKVEPGASDQRLTISVFVSRAARRGEHTLMLVGPNGSLPLAFQVTPAVVQRVNDDGILGRRLRLPGARNNSALDDTDDIVNPASTITSVASVTPGQLQPGATTDASLVGANLAQTRAVRVSGTGIRAEILRASDSEVQVRFTVDATALPGSHIVTLQAGSQTATTLVDIAAAAPIAAPVSRQDHARLAPMNDDSAAPAAPQLQLSEIAMTPSHPRLGDTVTFSVQVTNEGSTRSSGVPVEFSIAGTNARTRQPLTLEAGQSQRLEFEWRATQAGHFAPKVVLDPDATIAGLDHSQTTSALPAFELAGTEAPAAPLRQPVSSRERTRLSLVLGGCTGLRLVSGSETSCNGAADVSIRLASVAAGLRIEADGVRNLGAVPLEQVNSAPASSLASSDTLLSGHTYLVQAGRQTVALRVVAIRGLESLRNAPPAPLRAPRLDGSGGFGRAPITTGEVTVILEWEELPQR